MDSDSGSVPDDLSTAVLAAIDQGVVVVAGSGTISYLNTAASDILGLDSDVIGTAATDSLPFGDVLVALGTGENHPAADLPDDAKTEMTANGRQFSLSPDPDGIELTIVCGDRRWQFVVRSETVGDDPVAGSSLLLFRDVSMQRQIEAQLQTALGYSSDLVALLDTDGSIQYLNSASETSIEIPYDLAVSDTLVTAVHPDDRAAIKRALVTVAETGESVSNHCRIETAGDGWKLFELTIHNTESLSALDGLILTARDITEQHRFEQRRQVMNRVLRHDLRNDMNVVIGHAEMLAHDDDETVAEHGRKIRKKALSLVNLGEKVRTIDQQLHGMDRQLRQLNLSRIVREEIEAVHEQCPHVVIRSRINETVIIGNSLVRTAIRNLLDNSIEHNDTTCPEIEVSTTYLPDTDQVQLEISDNGPGIPAGEKQVIAEGVETPLAHNSGLGLWLVKWIVDGMDGTLSITTNSPRGAVVQLILPAADDESPPAANDRSIALVEQLRFEEHVRATVDGEPISTTTRSGE